MITSCSSLDSLKQSYKNFLPPSSDSIYIVEPGDSVWSIAINFNLDTELLIQNNNLKKPYTIYPNQELRLSGALAKNSSKKVCEDLARTLHTRGQVARYRGRYTDAD